MIGYSHSLGREKIGLKLSVMDVGSLVISSMNAQENKQSGPILMV